MFAVNKIIKTIVKSPRLSFLLFIYVIVFFFFLLLCFSYISSNIVTFIGAIIGIIIIFVALATEYYRLM